jgi:hypothetical protein
MLISVGHIFGPVDGAPLLVVGTDVVEFSSPPLPSVMSSSSSSSLSSTITLKIRSGAVKEKEKINHK